MLKKTVIWGIFLFLFVVALSSFASADQSTGYQQYYNEGVKAFKEHDDQKALRCFKIAQVYGPAEEDINQYLDVLNKKGVTLELSSSHVPPERSIGYRYYFSEGIKAFQKYDIKKALRYFKIAKIFDPASKESERYLSILDQMQGIENPPQPVAHAVVPQVPVVTKISQSPVAQATVHQQTLSPPAAQSQPAANRVPTVPAAAVQAVGPTQLYAPQAQPRPQAAIYVPEEKSKKAPLVLLLAQITNNGQVKPKLQIALHSSVIIESKNIKRFLVVDESFIKVKIIDADHLEIDTLAIGPTFLHIWDDGGRHTLYVEVIFPRSLTSGRAQAMDGLKHGEPFKVTYNNDWTTYYSGKDIPALKRQSYDFEQTLAITGETPYGFFDTSGSYSDFDAISQFDTYTIGLSQIPFEGTSNFNLRGFDALRSLSQLAMPKTSLRGAFADVDVMKDILGLSVSYGQEQRPLGFAAIGGGSQFLHSDIAALKLTLFPKSINDQYSFNFATAYGPDRPVYLTNHVYSVQGQHSFNDHLSLNAEEGYDSSHDATLASLKWQKGAFNTGLNFRNIDKNYSTISTLPSYQGETGASWTTDTEFENMEEYTFVEAYRDRLDPNLDHPSALDYDANGHFHVNIARDLWSDSDFNYLNTAGDLSPTNSLGLNERLFRRFAIWHSLQATVFGGAGYQNSHTPGSNVSNFDREDVITGINLPLTRQLSFDANYEYDWLDQPHSGGNSNPSVINVGLGYQKQFTPKLSFTSQVSFHDELGIRPGVNSFGSGEESVIITSDLNYNPMPDVNIFADADASKVVSHIGNLPYDDFEAHVGMRITFGGATYWDPLGTVCGVVFKDKKGNGRFIPGDEGIPGVKVKVGNKEAVTDKYGRYHIQIRAKGVDVTPVLDTIQGSLMFSSPQILHVRVFQGRTSHADFGLTSQTGIYGIVFISKNGANAPGEGDKFIAKVSVVLDGKTIQKSDPQGAFYFRNVFPGKHVISIDINTLALNMVPLVKLKNKIDVAEGTNYMFNIPLKIEKAENQEK